jgi:nucleotide-binding universal stress UspA family protein
MFRKILVALDRSPMNKAVFQAALDLAKNSDVSLMLLHVPSLDDPESPSMPALFGGDYHPLGSDRSVMEIYQELWQAYEAKGLEMLKQFAAEASAAGVPVEYSQNSGPAGRVICEFAKTMGADLVVLGRRGHSGFNELLLGSVSNYVMHHVHCSLLTVQHCPSEPAAETSTGT